MTEPTTSSTSPPPRASGTPKPPWTTSVFTTALPRRKSPPSTTSRRVTRASSANHGTSPVAASTFTARASKCAVIYFPPGLLSRGPERHRSTVSNFRPDGGSHAFDLTPLADPSGTSNHHKVAVADANATPNRPGAVEFSHRIVTAVENDLLAWYRFDEVNGTLLPTPPDANATPA